MNLPAIDLATLERAAENTERERLRHAVRAFGAFALTGHGIGAPATATLLDACRRFFALPQTERDAIDMLYSPHFRGYSATGTELTRGRPDVREQFDVGPDERRRSIAPGDPPWLRLHGPNLWPAAQPDLQPIVLAWMERSRAVAARILSAVVQSVGRPPAFLADGFSGAPHERLKIIRYPPAAGRPSQGVGEHSDSGFVTLIADDGSPGLHLRHGENVIAARVPAGALVVILGRALHDATSGATHAVGHYVTSPAGSAERISVAYFLNPRLDYERYGDEALRVVLRSHPKTAQRFFADVQGCAAEPELSAKI